MINNNEINRRISSLFQFTQFIFRKEKEFYKPIISMLKKDVFSQLSQINGSINQFIQNLEKGSQTILFNNEQILLQLRQIFQHGTMLFQRDRSMEIKSIEVNINNMDPKNVLKRGYTITVHKGRAINCVTGIKEGYALKTILVDGTINSNVISTEKSNDQ